MTDPVADGARAAASRLATQFGARLEADVEAALYVRGSDSGPEPSPRYLDPVALAGLIVTVAGLAWQIFSDLREKHGTPPQPDVVARQVRTHIRQTRTLDDGTEQVIDVTVEETLRELPPHE